MSSSAKYEIPLIYCLKCKEPTESTHPRVEPTSRGGHVMKVKCATPQCGASKSRFISKATADLFSSATPE